MSDEHDGSRIAAFGADSGDRAFVEPVCEPVVVLEILAAEGLGGNLGSLPGAHERTRENDVGADIEFCERFRLSLHALATILRKGAVEFAAVPISTVHGDAVAQEVQLHRSILHYMKAAVLHAFRPASERPLRLETREIPEPDGDEVLLKVRACGVCRTDLHIVEGELPQHRSPVIPGHQIVGVVVRGFGHPAGSRVGVSWAAGIDGTCAYCRRGEENLCDRGTFTGYDRDGGYAQYVTARAGFCYPLPDELDDMHAAPLLCAGVIGFRTIRIAGVKRGERVGLFGFGASAHLVLPVLRWMDCAVYVSTRGERHRELARELGARWVGDSLEKPPVQLDRALTFAPSGDVVISALSSLRKGGVVAINAIHLDRIPQFDYDSLLWGERQIRSVTNMTRADARDFLALAREIGLRPQAKAYALDDVNDALRDLKDEKLTAAAAVIVPED